MYLAIVALVIIVLSIIIQLTSFNRKNIVFMVFITILGGIIGFIEIKQKQGIQIKLFSNSKIKVDNFDNYNNLFNQQFNSTITIPELILLYGNPKTGKTAFIKKMVSQYQPSAAYIDIITPINSFEEGLTVIFGSKDQSQIIQYLQAQKGLPLIVIDHVERSLNNECHLCKSKLIIFINITLVSKMLYNSVNIKIILVTNQVSQVQRPYLQMKEFENDVRYDWLQQAEKEKRDYQSYWKEKSVELFNQNEKIKELLREFKRLQKEGNQNIQISDLRNNVNVFDIALLDECLQRNIFVAQWGYLQLIDEKIIDILD